jgi:prevent-host-death family protein
MKSLNLSDARKQLPALVDEVRRSKRRVVLTRYGKPVASIVPFQDKLASGDRLPLRGLPISVAKDFDAPLPEIWAELDG